MRIQTAALAVAWGVGIALAMTVMSVAAFGSYGLTLFVATPFVMGGVSACVFNRDRARSWGPTVGVVCLSILLSGGWLLALAQEGLVCLIMAAPLALVMGLMGAGLGRAVALGRLARRRELLLVLVALPILAGVEGRRPDREPAAVVTTVDVDAPPERVWAHVVEFSELPEPTEWAFRLGIAYPQRARIAGRGVGAVRRCEFSTGAFVEPIVVWDEPRRLAFDVTGQPPSMQEWSPYASIHPPHLDGYLRSVHGEFRLERLPGGRTRLHGTTWYYLEVFPQAYWSLWSDALIHKIHARVLMNIKARAEAGRNAAT